MKVLLGMSGGIDSTYAVTELRRQGYEVIGAFLKMTEDSETASAVRAAEVLNVPLTIVDCTERFRNIVIENFLSEYAAARTPNPCIVCNRFVKIAVLCETAKAMGISKVATGHYAKIGYDEALGRYFIRKAADPRKDPSAHKLDSIEYKEILSQGLAALDSTATSFSMDNHMPILAFGLNDPENIYRAVMGEEIGTLIKD